MKGHTAKPSVIFVLLSVVASSLAAVGLGPATVHDNHPDQCYNEKMNAYFSPGDSWQLDGCGLATCTRFSQSSAQLMISYESCGVAAVQPPCYLVEDNTKPYPDCCPQVVCPESDNDEEFDTSSEEIISGMNRTASYHQSSSVNDLAGPAVHFSLGKDEDNVVDRSERNDLQSLEESEEEAEANHIPVEEDRFELGRARRIPFRFQFAHFYDIGSDHEQRLNDVDAEEDYQLV